MITILTGGTGGRRLFEGFLHSYVPKEINVIVNVADDIEIYGLHISPDLDSILYAATGMIDDERGWGIKNDTFNFHSMITKIIPTYSWFNLGDKDLAIHVVRTNLLKSGMKLCEVTKFLASKFNVDCNIIPMSDDRVTTYIFDGVVKRHFQEFWVLYRAEMPIKAVIFDNIEEAKPCDKAIDAIISSKLVIIGPSNPITSINPILSLKGFRNILIDSDALKIAVSPILGNAPFSGPAGKLMQSLGIEVSSYGVATIYKDLLDYIIIDESDTNEERIKELGIEVLKTNISLKTIDDRIRLAKFILEKFMN
jgi:LPPG:FO 2-phospho-L-lactate transferase